MDKITQYQQIIVGFLDDYVEATGGNGSVQRRIIADYNNNSFQLLSAGWKGNHYLFGPIFHFDIIDGKIWMQCNNTELEVVDELMNKGVDKQDIVLGFIPPYARIHTGFATA